MTYALTLPPPFFYLRGFGCWRGWEKIRKWYLPFPLFFSSAAQVKKVGIENLIFSSSAVQQDGVGRRILFSFFSYTS